MEKIPFNRPGLFGNELEYVQDAIKRGHISGDGYYGRHCEEVIKRVVGARKALLTTSCTHALEMASLLLRIQSGDEVIVPSYTFTSTVNSFALRGAVPVFVDIRRDTLNIDETLIPAAISEKTKAIVIVHYAGVGCEMDAIMEIAHQYSIPVVEDYAHGMCSKYKGKLLGTFGALATLSFHETKNVNCGEGGALVINDERFDDEAVMIREKGTNRQEVFQGIADKYTWRTLGSSYVQSDMLAGFLYGQLEKIEVIQGRRRRLWDRYQMEIRTWAEKNGVIQPAIPRHCTQSFHMYYLICPSEGFRNRLIRHLDDEGIMAVFHYLPLHLSRMGKLLGRVPLALGVTEAISSQIIRLPLFPTLEDAEQLQVCAAIKRFH